jgi:basic membrane protein A
MSSGVSKPVIAIIVIVIIGVAGFGAWYLITSAPQLPENPYDVAIVFATGGRGDKSFNDAAYKGATDANTTLGMNFAFAEPNAIADYEGAIRDFARHANYRDPYKLIISIGFDQADAVMKIANESPSQRFAIVDMFINPGVYPNVTSLLFKAHEGSALVGAMAGLMTQTNKTGFVGGMDIDLINNFAAGYIWGVNHANPSVNVTRAYVGGWADIPTGLSLANGMYSSGIDIIFAAAGRSGLGVLDAAKATNGTKAYPVWGIGVDSPQMYYGTNATNGRSVVLTSMLKRVDVAVYRQFEAIKTGTWSGTVINGGLAEGLVGYELNATLVELPTSVISYLYALETAIIAGTYVVPDHL